MERIKNWFEELNFPGAERLKKALKNRGIPFTKEQVDDLVRGETVKQIQRAAPPLRGKVAAPFENSEWQSDLIDWTTAPSEDAAAETKSRRRTQKGPEQKQKESEKYSLVVQDVFSRKIWHRALVTKQPPEVQRAFKQIVEQVRDEGGQIANKLTTDKGGEFVDVKNTWKT